MSRERADDSTVDGGPFLIPDFLREDVCDDEPGLVPGGIMTRHGGGGFSGGGGGGGTSFGSHGRAGGGSFGPCGPSHHPPPPSHHRPPVHHHHHPPPIFYGPPPILYASAPRVGGPVYQMPPPSPEVIVQVDRRKKMLDQSKAVYSFILIALLIGTVWLYFSLYGSTVVELGVHDSRLVTARPFFVDSIKFKNRHETEGPLLYTFDNKPPLNQESSWMDSQNVTFNYGHREFFYWLNKGSTVTIDYVLEVDKKLESVYLAMIKDNLEDLEAYYDRPNVVSKPLHGQDVLKYEVEEDADYAFSLLTYNPEDVTVYLKFHFHTREYSTSGAVRESRLKTESKISLSFLHTRYGLLKGPGYDKMAADVWEIELSYGTRWTAIIFVFGLVTLVYLVTKSIIMTTIHELDPSLSEYAPLVPPQQAQATVPAAAPAAPSAPILPGLISEEKSEILKNKEEKDTEQDVSEDKLCSVCLDAPKDSFFVPCGHRATCYSCGLRISLLNPSNCPICRQAIGEVKKIYDA